MGRPSDLLGIRGFDLSGIGSLLSLLPCGASLGRFLRDQVCCLWWVPSSYTSTGQQFFICSPFLEGSTSSLNDMICPDLVQCVSCLFGKPLLVLKQLFAFSLSGSFLSAHPPTHGGGGGGLLGLDAVRGGGAGEDCMVGACGRLCCSIELRWAGPGGSGDRARVTHPLPPPNTTRARVVIVSAFVCLPTRPPTGGLGFVFLSGVVSP